jgi:hypothetical protein
LFRDGIGSFVGRQKDPMRAADRALGTIAAFISRRSNGNGTQAGD